MHSKRSWSTNISKMIHGDITDEEKYDPNPKVVVMVEVVVVVKMKEELGGG